MITSTVICFLAAHNTGNTSIIAKLGAQTLGPESFVEAAVLVGVGYKGFNEDRPANLEVARGYS